VKKDKEDEEDGSLSGKRRTEWKRRHRYRKIERERESKSKEEEKHERGNKIRYYGIVPCSVKPKLL